MRRQPPSGACALSRPALEPESRPLPPRAPMAEAGSALSPEAEAEEEADEELLQLETEPPAVAVSGRAAPTAPGGAVRLLAAREPFEAACEEDDDEEGDGEESEPLLGAAAAAAGWGRRAREGTGELRRSQGGGDVDG